MRGAPRSAVLELAEAACVNPAAQYRVIDLGALSCPNGHCGVGNVNDSCEVAGYDENAMSNDFGIVWQPTPSGVWTKVTLPPPTLQYAQSATPPWAQKTGGAATSFRAFTINNAGEVIGLGKGPRNEAVLWWMRAAPDRPGIASGSAPVGAYLGGLPNPGPASEGYGINNLPQAVGNSKNMVPTVAYRWSAASGMTSLGLLPNNGSAPTGAVAIDDRGDIVGDANVTVAGSAAPTTHAFFWDPSTTTMLDLGDLPGGQDISHGAAVMNSGSFGPLVVGTSGVSGGGHAFRWQPSTGLIDLPGLANGSSGANAVGAFSGIVGYSVSGSNKIATGWPLLDLANATKTTPVDLNTVVAPNPSIGTFTIEEATGVNTIAMIAAIGRVTAGGTSTKHGFLLVPSFDDLPLPFGTSFFQADCGRPAPG